MEREMASIVRFILDSAGNPAAIFGEVKQGIPIPSIYFPTPELESGGETLKTYRVDYTWYLTVFHRSTREAHEIAFKVYTAIKGARNLIHLVDRNGDTTKETFRLGEPSLKPVDSGAVQLAITFTVRRPYDVREVSTAMDYLATLYNKKDGTVLFAKYQYQEED